MIRPCISRTPGWLQELLVQLIFVSLLAWHFRQVLSNSIHFVLPLDTSEFLYPLEFMIARALKHGECPLWDPYAFAGYPLVGYAHYGLFYPLNWLFWLFPYGQSIYPIQGYEYKFIFHCWLAGTGAYLLTRSLQVGRIPSMLSGTAYMLMPNMMVWNVWGDQQPAFAWWPITLACLLQKKGTKKWRYTMLAAGCLGMTILAAPAQPAIMLLFMIMLLYPFQAIQDCLNGNRALPVAIKYMLIAALGLMIGAVSLLPIAEFTSHSVRFLGEQGSTANGARMSFAAFTHFHYATSQLLGLLDNSISRLAVGDDYIGLCPLVLSLLGLFFGSKQQSAYRLYFALLAALSLLYMFNIWLPALFYLVPGLNMIREPGRYTSIFCLAVSIMSAFGLQTLSHTVEKYLPKQLAQLLALTVVFVVAYDYMRIPINSLQKQNFDVEQHFASQDRFRTLKPTNIEPSRVFIWRSGSGRDGPTPNLNLGDLVGIYNIFGYGNPVSTNIVWAYNQAYIKPQCWRLLNVRYIVTDADGLSELSIKFPGKTHRVLAFPDILINSDARYKRQTFFASETSDSANAAWMPPKIVVTADVQQSRATIEGADFDPANEVIVTKPLVLSPVDKRRSQAQITWHLYGLNQLKVTVNTPASGIVVFSELYYPGWIAYVNGKKEPMLQADWLLRGVVVPTGRSTIELKYQPLTFLTGAALCLAALFLGLFVSFVEWRKVKPC